MEGFPGALIQNSPRSPNSARGPPEASVMTTSPWWLLVRIVSFAMVGVVPIPTLFEESINTAFAPSASLKI